MKLFKLNPLLRSGCLAEDGLYDVLFDVSMYSCPISPSVADVGADEPINTFRLEIPSITLSSYKP